MVLWVSLVVAVIGALVYALASAAKPAELGRLAYLVGLFWLIAQVGKVVVP